MAAAAKSYIVTGGEDGLSGIELEGKRFEPGDKVPKIKPAQQWLVDEGYLAPADQSAPATDEEGEG